MLPRLFADGSAVVNIHSDGSLNYGAYFNLPGQVQAFPRGELFALLWCIQRVQALSEVEL